MEHEDLQALHNFFLVAPAAAVVVEISAEAAGEASVVAAADLVAEEGVSLLSSDLSGCGGWSCWGPVAALLEEEAEEGGGE